MRPALRLVAALAVTLSLANCAAPMRGLRIATGVLDTSHHLVGYVCETAERVHDQRGAYLGLRFVAAVLGEDCETGGREIHVAAALKDECIDAAGLEIGQTVTIEGDLAARIPQPASKAAAASPPSLREPLYATSIRPGRRR